MARVESKTWLCTGDKYQTVPHVREGVQGILGQWKSPEDAFKMCERFRGCMAGIVIHICSSLKWPKTETIEFANCIDTN